MRRHAIRTRWLWATLALLAILSACSKLTAPAQALYFIEHDPGSEPNHLRMIITAGFVRMDGGQDSPDFLLFDRADGSIYNVSRADKQVLVIHPRPVELKPPEKFTHRVVADKAAYPSIDDHKVTHYELLTNETRCYDLYAAEGLLPEALVALREYRLVLAGQQALTAASIPPDSQSPCDLANNIFLPTRHLEHGFPIRLMETGGRTMELVDYKTDFRATADLFRLPAEYKRLDIAELRGK